MALQCPRCASDNVQKVEMAYKAGTSSLAGSVTGGGVGISTLGVGVGVGSGKLSGTQQTELAKSLAPPKNQLSTLLALMLVAVPGVTFMMLSLVDTYFFRAGLTWVAAIAVGVGIVATVIFMRSNMASKLGDDYRKSMDSWSKCFICFKCGMQFIPAADVSSSSATAPDLAAINEELTTLVRIGKKVDAVKRYREITGARLEEAVKHVESL